MPFSAKAADKAQRFFERVLVHCDGEWAGQPFTLLPWQRDNLIRPLFGTLLDDGETRQYRTCYVEVPRKNGKALAIDTLLPTPAGWVSMGDIQVGDTLFDEQGNLCAVTATTPIMYGRPCCRVCFSDGTAIVADEQHEWLTEARVDTLGRRSRKGMRHGQSVMRRIRTTAEIRDTVTFGSRNDRNHSMPLSGPLRLPDAQLPIDPYVLGAWLGDGATDAATLTCGYDDVEVLAEIAAAGVAVKEMRSSNLNSGCFLLGSGGRSQHARDNCLQVQLRRLGVLGHKHIPSLYLRGSVRQRLALLQGLMDTDGHATRSGDCEFTSTSSELACGVLELVRSLGFKTRIREERARLCGRDCGPKYRIQFAADADIPVFRLDRKHARQRSVGGTGRSRTRQIASVDPVDSVPVRCIQVDSPSHLYLAGEAMIPTHNSQIAAGIALYLLFADGEPGAQIYGAAGDRDQATIVYRVASEMVRRSSILAGRAKVLDSTKRIIAPGSASFYRAIPADAAGSHGFNASGVVVDEVHVQPNRDLIDVLNTSTGARRQPLTFYITTAGYDVHSICYELHDYALKVKAGVIDDPTFLPVVYSAAESDDWTDPAVWRKANPSLGATVKEDYIARECKRAQETPAYENTFRRLHLNQWVRQETRWLPLAAWDECAVPVDPASLEGHLCYGGLDLSTTTDISALVLAFPSDDGTIDVLPWFWIPGENIEERERRDKVPYGLWVRQGLVEATEGNVIDYGYIRRKVNEMAAKYNIAEIAHDPWNATQLSLDLTGDGVEMIPMRQGYASMSAPTKELLNLVLGRKIRHGGHPVLRFMADSCVVTTDPAGNIKPDKAKSTARIDGIVATIMAVDRCSRNEGASVYEDRGLLVL